MIAVRLPIRFEDLDEIRFCHEDDEDFECFDEELDPSLFDMIENDEN